MSLSSTINRISYSGNGATLAFSFPYYFLADEDLVVISRVTASGVETTKTLTTDYTVTGEGVPAGGTVTMLVAPATGTTLTIYRDPAKTQDLNLVENEPLPAEELEERLDKQMMVSQRLSDRIDRAFRLTDGYAATLDTQLPTPSAGLAIGWNATEDGLTNLASAGDLSVSSYIETLLDDANAAAARTTLGLEGVISLTTKGDLPGFSTVAARIPIGSNGQRLVADSTQTLGLKWAYEGTVAKTANYTLTTADEIVEVDSTAGTFTITIPTAVGITGKKFTIIKKNATPNTTAVSWSSTQAIGGATSGKFIIDGDTFTIVSNGAGWDLIAKVFTPVSARYTRATAQSIASGSATTFLFTTSIFDTHAAFNTGTGLFTAPFTGKYQFGATLTFSSATAWTAAGQEMFISLFINGATTNQRIVDQYTQAAFTSFLSATGTGVVSLTAGDTVALQLFQSTGSSQNTHNDANLNHFYVTQIE